MGVPSTVLQTIAVSPGIAIGRVVKLHTYGRAAAPERTTIAPENIPAELDRLHHAIAQTVAQLEKLRQQLDGKFAATEAAIFDAHRLLLEDHAFIGEIEKKIQELHCNSEYAIYETTEYFIRVFGAIKDEYLQERATDLCDVASRLMDVLGDVEHAMVGLDDRRIVIASSLSPSETARLDTNKVLGFAVETGSITSHTAILARSLKLPAVVGISAEMISALTAEDKVIIDGFSGKVLINPDSSTEEAYRLKAKTAGELFTALEKENDLSSETQDGFIIPLAANVDAGYDIDDLKRVGACGVGLFRTEFLFLNTNHLPTEEEQFEIYKKLLIDAGEESVTIRTMDIGGDKFNNSVYHVSEPNPFLGLRGIRLALYERRDLFETQLRALLRAGVYGNLQVMVPMVSNPNEMWETREIISRLQEQLKSEGKEHVSKLKLGAMIETPVAALMAEHLADVCDFFSIGTNDLVQYTMAIDRGNERVAYLYRPAHPAILRLIRDTVEAARVRNIPVGVCGQMAADPVMVPLLLGVGVQELSMAVSAIPVVRRAVRSLSLYEAEQIAEEAMKCSRPGAVLELAENLMRRIAPELVNV